VTETPPDAVAEVEDQVEQVRGLDYEHPVAIDAVTHDELVDGLLASFDHSYPKDLYDRRSRAWETIGVIPGGTSLRDANHEFLSSQVIGYYDPSTGQLVFIGTENPTPYERYVLAHELTHADDDQHFHLARLNDLEDACDDEGLQAAIGAVEGSAVYFSLDVVDEFFSPEDQSAVFFGDSGGGRPEGVPPFVYDMAIWPYQGGPEFIRSLRSQGGLAEVNDALRTMPPTTEQILHPERFPDDGPVKVDVPDLGPALGPEWEDLDVMQVGELWLRTMLGLRLGEHSVVYDAAAGWGGGQYRAWTDGTDVAVVLQTEWDTPEDAAQFLDAAGLWTAGSDLAVAAPIAGDDLGVAMAFASDDATLAKLTGALGAGGEGR